MLQRSVSGVLPGKQQELLLEEQPQCSLMRPPVQQRSGLQVWQRCKHSPGEAEVASMSLVLASLVQASLQSLQMASPPS